MPSPASPPSRTSLVAAALFAPTVLFLSAGNNIVLRNLLDLPYRVETVRFFMLGFGISGAVAVPVFLLARRSALARVLARACVLLGVWVLLAGMLAAVRIAAHPSPTAVAALDAVVLLGAAVVVFRMPVSVLYPTFGTIALVLGGWAVVQHAMTLLSGQRQDAERVRRAETVLAQAQATPANAAGNVYHIILDAFQTEAYMALAEQEPAFRFPGFRQYTEFTAHYPRTHHSVPGMLAGRCYRAGESLWAWREEGFSGGLWAALARAGVTLHLYPHYPPYCSPLAAECEDATTLADSIVYAQSAASPTDITIDLWFLSLLPPSVHDWITAPYRADPTAPQGGDEHYGFSVTAVLSGEPPPSRVARPDAPPLTHSGAFSVLNFDRLLEAEAARPARGQYVFFHAILPHWPFVVNSDCTYIGEATADSYEAYMAQAICALRMVERLVAELQRLDRYEDALIVVHADHGGKGAVAMLRDSGLPWPGPEYGPDLQWLDGDAIPSDTWPHYFVDMYRRALLLVKYPGTQGFTVDPVAAQTIDVAPTILHHVGGDGSAFGGLPLQAFPASAPEREILFYASSANPTAHQPARFSEYVYEDGMWRFRRELRVAD